MAKFFISGNASLVHVHTSVSVMLMSRSHMILSTDTEKVSDKAQHPKPWGN